MTCRITIASDLRERFPSIQCGAFVVSGLDRFDPAGYLLPTEALRAQLESAGLSLDTLLSDARIAGWRRALQSSGLKPSKFRSSAEQLVRRALRGEEITAPLLLVRLYCQISALHVAPLGAYDVGRLPGHDIRLRHARTDDAFEPLGADSDSMPLTGQVPVYAAGHSVLCWAFNVRDSARTALRADSVEAIFSTESVYPEQEASARNALYELRRIFLDAGLLVNESQWTGAEGWIEV